MTKDDILENLIIELSVFQKHFIESSKRIFEAGGHNLFMLDFFASAVNNRAISLINAYVALAKEKNYLTAVSLIRLQLDNALRFFASTLVLDSNKFVMYFLEGREIRGFEDANGKKLTDNHLAKQLDSYYTGTYRLYKDTCGFIHLSDKHFFPTLSKRKIEHQKFGIQIGNFDCYSIYEKIDFTKSMIEVSKLVLLVVEEWKYEKNIISERIKKE